MTMQELATVTKLMSKFNVKSIDSAHEFTTVISCAGDHIDVSRRGDWLHWGPDGEFVASHKVYSEVGNDQ
jgi:hypothetical protein